MERSCPKCGKDYSSDPYWSTSLKRHINRKNSCIRTRDTKYIRDNNENSKPKGPEAHDLSHIGLDFDGSKLVPALTQIFDKYNSVCQPNTSRDIIMYYINGKVHHSSLAQFIYTIWYGFLIPHVFPIIKERGWDYRTYKFKYDVTDPYMPEPMSIARYKQSPYFSSDYYRYVEKSEAYPNIRNRLIQYFKQVSKQRRSEIRDLLLSQACRLRT
jgi:hypothetical protein